MIAIMDSSVPIVQPKKKISLAAVNGEWWIQNGHAEFADSNINDYGHEAAVIDYMRSMVGLDTDSAMPWSEYIMEKGKQFVLKKIGHTPEMREEFIREFNEDPMPIIIEAFAEDGFTKEEFQVADDRVDGRMYAMEHLGWIRVSKNVIQMHTVSQEILSSLVRGLEDIYDQTGTEEGMEGYFNIEVMSSNKYIESVDYDTIKSARRTGDLSELLLRQHKGWK